MRFILILTIFSSFWVWAISPDISPDECLQRLWTTKDGLPQTSITDLQFDNEGYLWISTFGGVVRFNGREFKYLNLPDPRVTKLFLDRDNNLWMGTENGFIFKKEKDEIFTFSIPSKKPVVRDLLIDEKGILYVATELGLWILENGKWSLLNDFEDPACGVLFNFNGTVYIGTRKGLYTLKKKNLLKEGSLLEGKQINAITSDKNGRLWVGTMEGIFLKEGDNWKYYYFSEKYKKNIVNFIYEDRHGMLWFNLSSNLFVRWNPIKNNFAPFFPKGSMEWIYCAGIVEDMEGSIWLGTSGGLFQISEGIAERVVGEDKSLDVPIRNLADDGEGGIYFSFVHCFGLGFLKNNKIKVFQELGNHCIYSIEIEGEKIWAGTGDGLYLKKDSRGFLKQDFLKGQVVLAILNTENKIYFGTQNGLWIFNKEKNLAKLEEYTSGMKIFSILKNEEKIFLGTNEGLIILEGDNFKIINEKDGLQNLFVRAIYIDKEKNIWIGTYGGGLYRYDGEKLYDFPEDSGLPKTIHLIAEDKGGRLWLSSNEGIFYVERKKLSSFIEGEINSFDVIWLNEKDGMLSRECNGGSQPAGFLSEDGYLWVPTVRGAVRINTNFSNNYIPPVYIENVLVDGRRAKFEEGKIKFPYGKHSLEIHCAALSYLYPEKCEYKSILYGWDEDFIDMGRRNVAYYSNLKPGNYKFKVIANNGFGLWNEKGAEIEIIVPVPFTRSIYFYFLIFISFMVLLISFVNIYTYSLRKRKENLEKIVQKETSKIKGISELASKANIFSSIDELMGFFYENFKDLISYQFIALLIFEERENLKVLKIVWEKLEEKEGDFLKDVEFQIEENIFNPDNPLIINNIGGENLFLSYLKQEGIRSIMVYPLRILEDNFGYIIFGSKKENNFSKEDVKTFEDISTHLCSSIKKTYLLEKLQGISGQSEKFYAMVLHDLRHPLSTINLYIDLLKEDIDKLNEEHKGYLLSMEKSAKEFNMLLGDLLDITLFRGRYLETNLEKGDFVRFLREIEEEIKGRVISRGFYWDSFIENLEIKVNYDPKRIKQVIENFLSNSLKYAPAGTTITFGLELLDNYVKVYLKDEGYIPDERKKIIEEVFSSSYEPKNFISKAGLGLYISKSIIEAHKGKIGFERSREGGSIFYFTLPVE